MFIDVLRVPPVASVSAVLRPPFPPFPPLPFLPSVAEPNENELSLPFTPGVDMTEDFFGLSFALSRI